MIIQFSTGKGFVKLMQMGLLSKSGIVDFRIFAMGEVAQAWPTHKAIS